METIIILLKIVISIISGLLAGFLAVYSFNRIPAKWLCDYHQEPDRGMWGVRIKKSPWTVVFVLVFTAAMLKLLDTGFLYALPGLISLWILLLIGIADMKYQIIPDQFVIALAVTALGFIPFHLDYRSLLFGALIGGGSILLIGIIGSLLIITAAFTPQAAGGGFVGSSVLMTARYGLARGLFTNESGMGSAPIVAAAAQTRNPVRQALVSATGTFWDTVIMCAITGIVLISTIISDPDIMAAGEAIDGAVLTSLAFDKIPVVGRIVLTFGLITFAFSTIIGWSYYGERGAEYLFGKSIIIPYKTVYVAAVIIGAIMSLKSVWNIADALNMLMAIPNLICILLLNNEIAKDTKYYLSGDNIDKIDFTPIPRRNERSIPKYKLKKVWIKTI
jgi:hypothetical protein